MPRWLWNFCFLAWAAWLANTFLPHWPEAMADSLSSGPQAIVQFAFGLALLTGQFCVVMLTLHAGWLFLRPKPTADPR